MKWLGYAWSVVANVFYVLVVVYIFSRINDQKLTVIVAVLGLIYVAIRSVAIGQALTFFPLLVAANKSLDELRAVSGLPQQHQKAEYQAAASKIKKESVKLHIDGLFLGVIGLICFGSLWSALN
jgi:hypothetical protein